MHSTASRQEAPDQSTEAERAAASAGAPSRAGRAAGLSLLGYAGSQLLRLGGNVVLTHILLREHFGVMALVQVFLTGLQLFSDVGIGPAIIQNKRGNHPAFLDTAWTIQVIRGVFLALFAWAGAAPFAAFYGEPMLATIIPIVGVSSVLQGLRSAKTFTLNRELTLGRIVLIELTSQGVALVVMIAWALATRSIWALAIGALVQNFVYMVQSHLLLPGRNNRPRWDPEAARALLTFGRWIFVSTALTFVSGHLDRLIFGRLVSMAEFGVYSIAALLASAPASALTQLNMTIVFPVYSRVQEQAEDLPSAYRRVRWPMLVMGGFATSVLIVGGSGLVRFLYDERYWSAGWMISLLGAGMWFGVVLEGTNGAVLLAKGLARWMAASSLGKVAGAALFFPLGFAYGGFPGGLVALAAAELCRYAVSAYAVRAQGLRGLRQDMGATAMVALATGAGLIAGRGVYLYSGYAWLETLAAVLVTTLCWMPLLWPFARRFLTPGSPAGAAS